MRELLSTDPGMRRWRFLDVRDPLRGEPWSPGARPARRYRTLTRRKASWLTAFHPASTHSASRSAVSAGDRRRAYPWPGALPRERVARGVLERPEA